MKSPSPQPQVKVVGITSPGDMGHAIGHELRRHGLDVVACLDGRSNRTKGLCRQAGLREVDSIQQLAKEADMEIKVDMDDEKVVYLAI